MKSTTSKTKASKEPRPIFSVNFGNMLSLCMLFGLFFSWVIHIGFSDVCLRAKSVGKDSENFIFFLRYQRLMNDLLTANIKRLKPTVGSVFVYDGDLKRRARVLSLPEDGTEVSASWVRLDRDDVYQNQLDAHKRNSCFIIDVSKIKDGIYKSQAKASKVNYRFSCPIIGVVGQVFGYVSYGYTQPIGDVVAKIEEAKSSELMKVLN